jgi:hypothetical protein
MLRWVVYLCVAIFLLAMITSPTEREFRSFAYNNTDTSYCKPYVHYQPYHVLYFDLFSINTTRARVAENKSTLSENMQTIKTTPVRIHQQRYLGLFGTFWKL